LLYLLNDTLGNRVVRVHQQGDHPSPRNQLTQQLKPLSRQPLVAELADPREVAARPGEVGDQAVLDRIATMPRGSPLGQNRKPPISNRASAQRPKAVIPPNYSATPRCRHRLAGRSLAPGKARAKPAA